MPEKLGEFRRNEIENAVVECQGPVNVEGGENERYRDRKINKERGHGESE